MGFNKESKGQPKAPLVWSTGLSGAPPDSVRCTRGLQLKLATFGNFQRRSAIIHRTVRCTPDSVRCSKEGRLRNSPASGNCNGCSAIIHRTCPVYTGLSGVHRTVRCNCGATTISAPTATCSAFIARQCAQKSGAPILAHRTLNSTCPVRHRTTRRAQKTELQQSNPNGFGDVAGAPDMSGVHRTVRCTIRQSAHQTASLVVGAINTPNHPHSLHPSFPLLNHLQELGIQF
jgi:hypothetical protein